MRLPPLLVRQSQHILAAFVTSLTYVHRRYVVLSSTAELLLVQSVFNSTGVPERGKILLGAAVS